MGIQNEFAVDMNDLAKVTESFKSDVDAGSPDNMDIVDLNKAVFDDPLGGETHPDLESDLEIESTGFWSETDENGDVVEKEESVDASEAEVEIPGVDQILRYKANGAEVELDLSTEEGRTRAIEELSKAGGMQKAFSETARYKKDNKNLSKKIEELSKYRESWDKLEDLKHDRQGLLEFVTGESYSDFMNAEMAKRAAYEGGTEDQRRIMDYEDRMQAIESANRRDRESRERDLQKAQDLRQEADYEKYNMWSQNELSKYVDKIPKTNEVRANKLKKALWRESIADVKEYYAKYGKITNKMVHKAFKDNADAILGTYDSEVQNGVDKAIENKKTQAKEKAQIAGSKNYDSGQINSNWTSMSPDKLFKAFKKGR